MEFDLEKRTTEFGKKVILFCQYLKPTPLNQPLINQLIRSATSIGANYHEANAASSKNDYFNKAFISRKEANETKYWLQMIVSANPNVANKCQELSSECQEILLILAKITSKSLKSRY